MSNSNTGFTFTVGSTIHVWKPTGVRLLRAGVCTSERCGGEYADIETSEDLVVVEKVGSQRAKVRREDGELVIIHSNHVNQTSKYYAGRDAKKATQGSLADRLKAAAIELQKKQNELAALQAQAEALVGVSDKAKDEYGLDDIGLDDIKSARDEAAALFASA